MLRIGHLAYIPIPLLLSYFLNPTMAPLGKKVVRETKDRHNYPARSRIRRGFGRVRVVWPLEGIRVLLAAEWRGRESAARDARRGLGEQRFRGVGLWFG